MQERLYNKLRAVGWPQALRLSHRDSDSRDTKTDLGHHIVIADYVLDNEDCNIKHDPYALRRVADFLLEDKDLLRGATPLETIRNYLEGRSVPKEEVTF